MAPPNHTTPEQHEWLTSLLPKFQEHQQEKNILDFWSMLDHSWFTRWPEPGTAEAELQPMDHPSRKTAADGLKKRKSYLRNWFNNRAVNKRKAPIHIQPPPKATTRSYHPVELYSQTYYKEKVKPLVLAEITEKHVPKKERLGVVKTLTRAAFDAESAEVRDAFFTKASLLKAENAAQRLQAREEPELTPQGYATSIQSVAYVLDSFIRDLSARTGWAFSVMGGGPDPANGGRIQTISFHEGRNSLGASFKKAHVSFDESVLKPYIEFLNQVYPPEVCIARALPSQRLDDGLYTFKNGTGDDISASSTVMEENGLHTQETSHTGHSDGNGDTSQSQSVCKMVNMGQPALNQGDCDMSQIDPVLRPPHYPTNEPSLRSHPSDNPSIPEHTPWTVPRSTEPTNTDTPVPHQNESCGSPLRPESP